MGCKMQGSTEELVESIDAAVAYRHKDAVFSFGTMNYCTVLKGAIFAEPYRNVRFGATMQLPLEEKTPGLAFGCAVKPSRYSETRVKVDTKGRVSMYYKGVANDKFTYSFTLNVEAYRSIDA